MSAGDPAPLGEEASAAPEEKRTLEEFVVIRRNGKRLQGHGGALTATRFTGTSPSGEGIDFSRDDIKTLYRKEGTQAGTMTLTGALAGLMISGVGVLQLVFRHPELFQDNNATGTSLGIIGGASALGALIGFTIGARTPTWAVEPLVVPGSRYSLLLSHSF